MSKVNPRIMLGNRIDIWQKKHGYSNIDVAKLVGCNSSSVSFWRCGKGLPGYTALMKMESLGVEISGIDGIPTPKMTPKYINDFCKKNKVSRIELCMATEVNPGTIGRFIKVGDCKAIESLAKIETFIDEYENPKLKKTTTSSCTKKEEQEIMEIVEKQIQEEHIEEPTVIANEVTEIPASELPNAEPMVITGLNAPAKRSYYKKVTLRELLGFAERFNIMDAEMITDGGFEINGFKLVIEEDGVPHLALKTVTR